jgi:23S rRNA-/tRNA-specific pseudouridylate synthase
VVDEPLLRESAGPGQGAVVRVSSHPDARSAVTEVDVLGTSDDGCFSLVEARPLTGRSHQIRVHLRSVGLPIAGDPLYGRPATIGWFRVGGGLWRPFLHAARVTLAHPVQRARTLDLSCPLPDDLLRALDFAGLKACPRRSAGASPSGASE